MHAASLVTALRIQEKRGKGRFGGNDLVNEGVLSRGNEELHVTGGGYLTGETTVATFEQAI